MAPNLPYKQELPPKGGYKKLNFDFVPPKKFMTGPRWFLINTVPTFIWSYFYKLNKREVREAEIENDSGNFALQPFILAERDREYLRQLRKNRDEERELMKDMKDWEVGKLYNQPIFKTVSEDEYMPMILMEYYAHTSEGKMNDYYNFRHNY